MLDSAQTLWREKIQSKRFFTCLTGHPLRGIIPQLFFSSFSVDKKKRLPKHSHQSAPFPASYMMLLGYVPEFLMKCRVAVPKTPQFSALNKKPTKQCGVSSRFFWWENNILMAWMNHPCDVGTHRCVVSFP